MTANRKAELATGLLYLLGMTAGILSVTPSVDGQDFLIAASANKTEVMAAAFFQTIMMAAYVGFAVVLYPLLKKHSEGLAAGFFGFRIIGGTFILIGVLLLPLLVAVSQEFVNGATPGGAHLLTLGGLLRTGRDLANHVGMILASSLGSILLYSLLFRAKWVPRWLSVWGLVGAVLAIAASMLVLFDLVEVVTTSYLALNVPIVGQEFVFAIWLIAKGFKRPTPEV